MLFNAKTKEDIDNLISQGIDINAQDYLFGQTFLHILVQTDSPLIDHFLSKRPNVNIQNRIGKSPIFYSCDVITFEKLVDRGASVFIKDINGKTVRDLKPQMFSEMIHRKLGKKYIQ